MSSANRTGSYSGAISAHTAIWIRLVTAATAEAAMRGEGRYPSSEPWCSDRLTASCPVRSAYTAMSRAARYRSRRSSGPAPGARKSNRVTT